MEKQIEQLSDPKFASLSEIKCALSKGEISHQEDYQRVYVKKIRKIKTA